MGANDRSTLYDFADKQDKFEHEYSSELVTRIGLFLVFAGFVSGVALELLKLTIGEKPLLTLTGQRITLVPLAAAMVILFCAMLVLLWAAILPGYSVPARVNEYRKKYGELLRYHSNDVKPAQVDLEEWILDATAQAVDDNSRMNEKRAAAITLASRLLLVAIISLFLALAVFVTFRFATAGNSQISPSPAAVEGSVSKGGKNGETKDEKEKQTQAGKEANATPK